jgi:osmoprotectant transport system ATP-binding protein
MPFDGGPIMIELRELRKEFGPKIAVNGVNLRVVQGERLVLLGPSGCGKTTLLRMINRLTEPTAGSVWIDGQDTAVTDPVALRRQIGYVIQGGGLLPHRTVREIIFIVPRMFGWTREKCEDRLFVLKAVLWLFDDWFDAYPSELSAGQRRRVVLARALMTNPTVLLMDEPFSGLDARTRLLIRREIRDLWALRDKTVVTVTHDITEGFEFGSRIALMSPGRIEQVGTPAELLFRPASAFVREFFDQSTRLRHEWEAVRVRELDLPDDTAHDGQQPTRLGVSPWCTVADAVAALGADTERVAQLIEAFQRFKREFISGADDAESP